MKKILLCVLGVLAVTGILGGVCVWKTYGNLSIPRKAENIETMKTDGMFTYPEGYTFTEFATGIPNARTIIEDPRGRLLVASMSAGKIVTLSDSDKDGKAETVTTLIDGLKVPHGMALRCGHADDYVIKSDCALYLATQDQLYMYPYYSESGTVGEAEPQLELPRGSVGAHKTRSLLFLPTEKQDKLLISIGSSCNVCIEEDTRRAAVLIFDTTSGKVGHYATGLRNAVFLALHPGTSEVYATEMSRDGLGDDIPVDEIDIVQEGAFYGWPWFYGDNVEDMTFKPDSRPEFTIAPTPPAIDIPAHSAPLGISFIPETDAWSSDYQFNAIVAYHGSWNRSEPTGYKVVRMVIDKAGNYSETKDLISGWLREDGKTIGRPAGVLALPDGTLYVTDDQAGKVYTLRPQGP